MSQAPTEVLVKKKIISIKKSDSENSAFAIIRPKKEKEKIDKIVVVKVKE